ncbi:MAG: Mur ligase family protein [Candidatus Omnitrophota bacterium]
MEPAKSKTTILGLGISGFQAARFLHRRGYRVFVTELQAKPELRDRCSQLRELGIEVEIGTHSLDRIRASDWVMVSPGIPPFSPVYQAVRDAGIPLYSEIEVASWFSKSRHLIAVTGTCGKTTVTVLLTELLKKAGHRAVSCGNIGNPWIGEIDAIRENDYAVLEVSSFQLEHCKDFSPHYAILTNLGDNHLDWHPTVADYVKAKLRIFSAQRPGSWALVRRKDRERYFPDEAFRAQLVYYDEYPAADENQMILQCMAQKMGLRGTLADEVVRDFQGIEHRTERVAEKEGICFVNDSKCTTVESLIWALGKYDDQKVLLIAGGHPKADNFSDARTMVSQKARIVFLIGEARPLLRAAWSQNADLREVDDLKSAVHRASEEARPGDVVLLSPACASFDQFKNYMDRGCQFKSFVRELLAGSASCGKEAPR